MDKQKRDSYIRFIDHLKEVYNFDGLYHFTDFSNLHNIFTSGFLKSRIHCIQDRLLQHDCANTEIINETSEEIKSCVRFYYKEKTPMLYKTEGIKISNSPPHVPIPVYLVFDEKLIYQWDTFFTDGNARSDFSFSGNDFDFFSNMDWGKIFHRGILNFDEATKREYTRKRHAELLCRNPVSIRNIKKVIFRCDTDKQRAINLFGDKPQYVVNRNCFNNKRNYIKKYRIEIDRASNVFKLFYDFNDNTFRSYSMTIRILDRYGDVILNHSVSYTEAYSLSWVNTNTNYNQDWNKVEVYFGGILCIEEFV